MQVQQTCSRRKFILQSVGAGMAVLTGASLPGCKSAQAAAREPALSEPPLTGGAAASPVPAQTTPQPAQAPDPCANLAGVSPEEQDKRKKLAYVNKSPIPDSQCGNCNLYIPPAKDKPCGGCMLFKGPVRSEAYCTYWAPIS